MNFLGYQLLITKTRRHKRTNANNYSVWSRKGRCPVCDVATGSKHSLKCPVPNLLKKGKEI